MTRQSALKELEHYRHEVELRRVLGGFDLEALDHAEGLIQECEQALRSGQLGLLLVHHANLVKHLVWARHPVRDAEVFRDRQSQAGQGSKSNEKERARELYRNSTPRPEPRSAFERLLEREGVNYTQDAVRKWYTEFRKERLAT